MQAVLAKRTHVDVIHPGSFRRDKTRFRVLKDETPVRIDAELFRRAQKKLRVGFAVLDLVRADENLDLLLWSDVYV